jgi:hypothetical protein
MRGKKNKKRRNDLSNQLDVLSILKGSRLFSVYIFWHHVVMVLTDRVVRATAWLLFSLSSSVPIFVSDHNNMID